MSFYRLQKLRLLCRRGHAGAFSCAEI